MWLLLGGDVVGTNALQMAVGMGANVTVLDKSLHRLRELDAQFGSQVSTIYATQETIEQYALDADLIVGAVLVPGAEAPKLITRDMLPKMRKGTVMVDVAIDQGGCFETSRPTTHSDPIYSVDGVVHYCVANMPGAAPYTSTIALNNATLPFALQLANQGAKQALENDPNLLNGLNIHKGQITYPQVAKALNKSFTDPKDILANW
ncbi:alanine dehydrogenase [Piscirickettsia litoralis]|nr:hypothetical protein [Piscirickettsia litoralis]